jgi:sulfur-oxidizing protein SoxB
MMFRRRDILKFAAATPAILSFPGFGNAAEDSALYDVKRFGNARILHMTDTHAQLHPVHFREPSVNIGVGGMKAHPPHLVGQQFLAAFGMQGNRSDAYAFTFLDFEDGAERYGKMGGFAHLRTLVKMLRSAVPTGRSVLLDGGDLWQGSGLANLTRGACMVQAANLLGIDAMTGHFEFTYGEETLRKNLDDFKGEFLAQNVFLTEEAAFNDAKAFDPESGRVFKPYTIREMGDYRVGIVGQGFPYVPVAHPKRFVPNWTFGIRDDDLQKIVDRLRDAEKVDAVVLLSHNGMDVDLKLASRVRGIDVILGGHTHDAVPRPIPVMNAGGKTLVSNAGSNGKFLAVLDLELGRGRVKDVSYHLLPVFSDRLKPDPEMAALIDQLYAPHGKILSEKLMDADRLLYRRGNFNGTMDELICGALRQQLDTQIALSPGFRWGPTVLKGQPITTENVMAQTAITYPEVYAQSMTGEQIKSVMEDICDNLFNLDPYYQQGGDMVRIGGMTYTCAPNESFGRRVSDLKLADGSNMVAGKSYRVAGWASLTEQKGAPVWDVVSSFLRDSKTKSRSESDGVKLVGVDDNPGYAY